MEPYGWWLEKTMNTTWQQTMIKHITLMTKLSRGRVEICKGGEHHTISADLWDKSDPSVVRMELWFSPHGEKAKCYVTYIELLLYIIMARNHRRLSVAHYSVCVYTLRYWYMQLITGATVIGSSYFSTSTLTPALAKVQCTGSEAPLNDCTPVTVCSSTNDAAIVCQGKAPLLQSTHCKSGITFL